eukprot:TRINITY_DN4218_c0_g1_i15.p1 TRINITY_DN4218_c0_g1~~TRINITY_DN4218_c0_g1_i15.p1  ORF type:complete len:1157 (+),score=227.03 TRINITY_DN4218_c0_g1_i15:119-3589(+)
MPETEPEPEPEPAAGVGCAWWRRAALKCVLACCLCAALACAAAFHKVALTHLTMGVGNKDTAAPALACVFCVCVGSALGAFLLSLAHVTTETRALATDLFDWVMLARVAEGAVEGVGEALLVVMVLPEGQPTATFALLTCPVVPAVVSSVFRRDARILKRVIFCCVSAAQVAALAVCAWRAGLYWELPLTLLLLSASAWEAHCDVIPRRFVSRWRERWHTVNTFRLAAKCVTLASSIVLLGSVAKDTNLMDVFRAAADPTLHAAAVSVVAGLLPLVCHLLAAAACKSCLQIWSFTIPLMLASPLSLGVTKIVSPSLECNSDWADWDVIELGCIAAAYVCAVVLTCEQLFRLIPADRACLKLRELFLHPFSGAMSVEACLILNRCTSPTQQKFPAERTKLSDAYVVVAVPLYHETEDEMRGLVSCLLNLDHKCGEDHSCEIHVLFDDALRSSAAATVALNPFATTLLRLVRAAIRGSDSSCRQSTERDVPGSGPSTIAEAAGTAAGGAARGRLLHFIRRCWRRGGEAAAMAEEQPQQEEEGEEKKQRDSEETDSASAVEDAGESATRAPYGARWNAFLPHGTPLWIHFKDSAKVKRNKRFSQVLLLRELAGGSSGGGVLGWDNVYVLMIDGDTVFSTRSMKKLRRVLAADPDVAAACGRIYPQGSGLLWHYQSFEYAAGHWLQKTAEDVFGTVLCSPGCFTMLRVSALLAASKKARDRARYRNKEEKKDDLEEGEEDDDDDDDEEPGQQTALAAYGADSRTAVGLLTQDQGEDRWLSTLLIRRGWKIRYCAVAKARTACPTTMSEFLRQRRRWIVSTLFNLLDVMRCSPRIVSENRAVGWPFVLYVALLLVASALSPATTVLMTASLISSAADLTYAIAAPVAVLPLAAFCMLCLCCRAMPPRHAARAAVAATYACAALYALVFVLAIAGMVYQVVRLSSLSPFTNIGLLMFATVVLVQVAAALCHAEWRALFHGTVYVLLMPTTCSVLIIYALFNMHDVSWGTRETAAVGSASTGADREAHKRARVSKEQDDLSGASESGAATDDETSASSLTSSDSESDYESDSDADNAEAFDEARGLPKQLVPRPLSKSASQRLKRNMRVVQIHSDSSTRLCLSTHENRPLFRGGRRRQKTARAGCPRAFLLRTAPLRGRASLH